MMSADASTPQRAQTPLATVSRAALIDEDGALSPRFEEVLLAIFSKYATKRDGAPDTIDSYAILPEGLDRFGRDTNGVPLPEEQLEEMRTFLDCDTEGNLLFKGFIQMYSLQTSSEEEETWRDLHSHGYNNGQSKNFSQTFANLAVSPAGFEQTGKLGVCWSKRYDIRTKANYC